MFFAVGILLFLGGVALLILGGFTLPNGRSVATRPARQMGGVFVSYFPILIIIHLAVKLIFGDGVVNADVIFAVLTLMYFIVGLVLFLRALSRAPVRKPKASTGPGANPFADTVQSDQSKSSSDPFHFS